MPETVTTLAGDAASATRTEVLLHHYWEGPFLHVSSDPTFAGRKLVFFSDHGDAGKMVSWFISRFGGHGLWGCAELAQRGYHVIMPKLTRTEKHPKLKHVMMDFRAARTVLRTLRPDDIVYGGHNVLFWGPLLATVGMVKARFVSQLFAKEPLPFAGRHAAIIGMTRIATEHARRLNPKAKCVHIEWAVELTEHLHRYLPYEPKWDLAAGVTQRDFNVVARAYQGLDYPLRVCSWGQKLDGMPANVDVIGHVVSPEQMVEDFYRGAASVLVSLLPDPHKREAVGCKNMMEAMALGRPIVKTRTGAMDDDIDVEKLGIGLYFEPGDAEGLRRAVQQLHADPAAAEAMGREGRRLCETHYNMTRYASDLHTLFESL